MKVLTFIWLFFILISFISSFARKQRQLFSFYHSYKYTIPSGHPMKLLSYAKNEQLKNNFEDVRVSRNDDNYSTFRDDISDAENSHINENHMKHNSQPEGSFCRRTFDGMSGYCMLAFQCLHIVREFRKHKIKIDICSYQNSVPVICCPLEEKNFPNAENQRISAQKCVEYNEMAWNLFGNNRRRNNKNLNLKCESSVPLIVGGERTYSGEYPHMAAIGWTRIGGGVNWACGGTLISERYILTAAHCTVFGGKLPDKIRLGDRNLYANYDDYHPPQEYNVVNVTVHPKYNSSYYYHDLALLQLSTNVNLTKFIRPACLWQSEKFDDIEIVTAIGWGRIKFMGPKSDELLKVDLKLINQNLCKNLYKDDQIKLPNGIMDEQFCAGHLDGGKDTCHGDSGGPIHIRIPKYDCINFVAGITSFGKYCAAPNAPGVYIKISSYLDWIENIVFS